MQCVLEAWPSALAAVGKQCMVVVMPALCCFKTGLVLGLFPPFLFLNAIVASDSLGTAGTELPTATAVVLPSHVGASWLWSSCLTQSCSLR